MISIDCIFRIVVPSLMVLGIVGSSANLIVMSNSDFTGSTFYYLRALSLCDLLYLICVLGQVNFLSPNMIVLKYSIVVFRICPRNNFV